MDAILQDIRFGVRMMLKSPGFTAAVVVALALGIGANAAIFSVVNAVLLRPLPFEEPERLVMVWEARPSRGSVRGSVSMPDFLDWRETNRSFDAMSAIATGTYIRTDGAEPERVQGVAASANVFSVLGVRAAVGRTFLPEEGVHGQHRAVVLGHGYWERYFGADPGAVGKVMTLDGEQYTVVGVLPEEFRYAVDERDFDVWVPFAPSPAELENMSRGGHFLGVVARLKPGVTVEQARADMTDVAARLEQQYPEENTGHSAYVNPMHEEVVGDVRTALYVLLGAVSFVLLVACANVANLMLVRSSARRREVAVRMSVGASRAQLARQFLTESVLLSLAGGALGLLVAYWALDLLTLAGADLPRAWEVDLDWRVLGYTFAVAVATGVAFGVAPAFQASRINLNDSLKEGSLTTSDGPGRRRSRGAFVVVQVALALVLLVGSGLMMRSLFHLLSVDPGFDPAGVLTMTITLPDYGYEQPEQMRAFYHSLVDGVDEVPGVDSAGAIVPLPYGTSNLSFSVAVEGRPPTPAGDRFSANWRGVSPGYLETMRIPVLRGRGLDERDREGAPNVILVNETMARTLFPGEEPIGQRITIGYDETTCEIVGVVGDVKFAGLASENRPEMYTPYAQTPWPQMSLVVRTTSDPGAVAAAVRSRVQAIDRDLPVYDVVPLEQRLADSLAWRRFQALLLGAFAGLALALAVLGIYGVLSYTVTQRTHEIGIRVAVGAERRDVLRLVLGYGLALTLAGLAVGAVAAALLTRTMSSMLYGVTATDPVAYAGVSALLLFVALLASYVPARRATRIDPLRALRHE